MLQHLGLGTSNSRTVQPVSVLLRCGNTRYNYEHNNNPSEHYDIICLFLEPPNLKLQHHRLLPVPVPDPSPLQVHYKHATHITIPQPDPLAILG